MFMLFFVKQKTAYELRISDWSSDVCSSDLPSRGSWFKKRSQHPGRLFVDSQSLREKVGSWFIACLVRDWKQGPRGACDSFMPGHENGNHVECLRSEEHTSELQSLMRILYAVFCLKKKKTNNYKHHDYI